ncbi:MAG: O-antigen ligase family protein [Ignavibacteria bacterium]|nr:O-antigen ligase family protein [Ignavibacteria bacterium]
MFNFEFNIASTVVKKPFFTLLKEKIFEEKLNNFLGFFFLILCSCLIAALVSFGGIQLGGVLGALLIGSPLILASMFNLKFGITFTLMLSFVFLGAKRILEDIPLGILMDVMIVVMLFGLFIRQINERNWNFAKNPISKIILVWIVYIFLELANPWAESRLAWLYTFRGLAGFTLMYFLLMYAIDSKKFIFLLIKVWLLLMTLAMIYGYYQEFFGLLPFELNWVMAEKARYMLLYQAGKFRMFSFFSDPLVYGFSMCFTGMLCFILAGGPFRTYKKVFLYTLGCLMIYGMLFSGTRAAFILPPAGFLFYSIIKFKKNIIITGGVLLFLVIILLNIPSSNPNLVRLQSAFKPSEDASYQVRVRNQAFIQPYIQSHPMGGGLGSVGEWGKKFSPWSPLANFPPDSGYVRIAVEMGSIGLFLFCLLLFIVFKEGIKDYFRIKDPMLKTISLGMLTVVYSLTLANFPQEAIGQYPINYLFFVAIAIINKCREFDTVSEKVLVH